MIRKFNVRDIDKVMELWLNTNIEVHNFIASEHWKSNYDMVKEMMCDSEIYIYEENGVVNAFIGLMDNYIAGIFTGKDFRSKGIGSKLIDYVKNIKNELSLSVYIKNKGAVNFYLREGFKVTAEGIDDSTGEKEYTMKWYR